PPHRAGRARGQAVEPLCEEPLRLPRDPGGQDYQVARRRLERRDRQGDGADPRRRRRASELPAEDRGLKEIWHGNRGGCDRSLRVPVVDLRAGGVRRLLRGVVGDASVAHAADVGDQRDLLGDRRRRAARGRRRARRRRRADIRARARLRRARVRGGQHLRRVLGHPAHAGDVPQEEAIERAMSPDLVALLYLVSGVLFILALRGLSSPETSRHGNFLGMAGMVIAVLTTLASHPPAGIGAWLLIVLGLALGGGAGAVIARRVPMTAMPQLVAAFHSLVGMAAVLVAAGALYAPDAFGIGSVGDIHKASLIEMSLGVAIGAVTFTGSVIAFLKLDGRMSGAPIMLPMRHLINIGLVVLLVYLVFAFVQSESRIMFWAATGVSFLIGILIIIPIGGADMPVVISMLNSYSGWAA